jgi:hypothetical protein
MEKWRYGSTHFNIALDKCEFSALHFQGKIPQISSGWEDGRVVEGVEVL